MLHNPSTTLLLAAVLVVGAGQTVVFAIVPPLSRSIGLTEVESSLIFTASAAAIFLSRKRVSIAADRWRPEAYASPGLLFGGELGFSYCISRHDADYRVYCSGSVSLLQRRGCLAHLLCFSAHCDSNDPDAGLDRKVQIGPGEKPGYFWSANWCRCVCNGLVRFRPAWRDVCIAPAWNFARPCAAFGLSDCIIRSQCARCCLGRYRCYAGTGLLGRPIARILSLFNQPFAAADCRRCNSSVVCSCSGWPSPRTPVPIGFYAAWRRSEKFVR